MFIFLHYHYFKIPFTFGTYLQIQYKKELKTIEYYDDRPIQETLTPSTGTHI